MQAEKLPILKGIINAMQIVVDNDYEFEMSSTYEQPDDVKIGDDIHTCGSAACVMGYAAFHPELKPFVGPEKNMHQRATRLWNNADRELSNAISPENYRIAADVIANSCAESRKCIGEEMDLPERLLEMKHLNSDDNDAQDALDFCKALYDYALTGKDAEVQA